MSKGYPVTALLALFDPDAIGIRTLASFVKARAGISVNQIFFKSLFTSKFPYTRHEINLLVNLIKKLEIELLGISIRSSSFKTAVAIIKQVREELKDVKIIIGGTHAILCPDECLALGDIVCLGEGEYPILNLIKNYSLGSHKVNNILGLWVKSNGRIYKNQINELIDINELTAIDYSDNDKWYIEDDRIRKGDPTVENSVGEVFSTRGCPYHCSYCSNSVLRSILNKGKFVRLRSVDNVIKDALNLKSHFRKLKKIVFADEVFALNQNWTAELGRKYKEQVGIPFAALFYPNMVRENTVKMLKNAGLTHARIGMQSGSKRIRLNLYKRNETNKEIIDIANIFHKYGIRVTFDIIVNNPYETEADLEESLEFYLKLPRPYEMNMSSLVHFPKTQLTEKALKDGIINTENVEGAADEALRMNNVLMEGKKMVSHCENNLFWNSLYSLASKSFVPRGLIRSLSANTFLRGRPGHLVSLARAANSVNLGIIALNLLKNRELAFSEVARATKSLARVSTINK